MHITTHMIAHPAQDVYEDVSMFNLNASEGQLLTCAEGELYISVYVGTDFTGKSQGVIALVDFIGGGCLPARKTNG